ncbi:hypothetical protein PG984_011901 [Apiospora sp. TS-2023a]
MLSIFQASFPRAGRLCRPTVRPTAAFHSVGTPNACPRLTRRHLETARFATTGNWNRSQAHPSLMNGKGAFARGQHRLTSTSSTPSEPPEPSLLWRLFPLWFFLPVCAPILLDDFYDDSLLVWNVLRKFDSEDRPPELVRMYVQIKSKYTWSLPTASLLARLFNSQHVPCTCHLDGLLTTDLTGPDHLQPPNVPTLMSMWLETARVTEEEQGGGFRERGTAITLYAAVNTSIRELEGPGSHPARWEPQSKWARYELPIIDCLEREERIRKRFDPDFDATYTAVVVCRDGFMIFDYDGQQLHLKKNGRLGPVNMGNHPPRIEYHWMPNPRAGSSTWFSGKWARDALDPHRSTLKPEQQCRHGLHVSSLKPQIFGDD